MIFLPLLLTAIFIIQPDCVCDAWLSLIWLGFAGGRGAENEHVFTNEIKHTKAFGL